MKNSALLIAVVLSSSCSVERETTYFAPPAVTAPSPVPRADPAPVPSVGPIVSGPSGCVAMATQPEVLSWTIRNVPLNAKIDKAYAHDEEPTCDKTDADLRTQNDHLRVTRDGTTITVLFDRNTYDCGRTQVDIDVDGVTLIFPVLYYHGPACALPPRPIPPSPPPPPPLPPTIPPIVPPPPVPPPPPPTTPPPPCASCECDKKFCPPPPPPPKPCPKTGDSKCPPPPEPPKPCKKGGDDKKPCKG